MGARDDDTELDALAAHARTHPALPGEHADRLIRDAASGDVRALEALVEQALSAVLEAAIARRDHGVELADLYQEGSVAALVAVQEYVSRAGPGAQLNPYVRRVVDVHLDRMVEREEAAAVESAAMVRDAQLLGAVQAELRRRGGREPTTIEMAAALHWAPERVEAVASTLAAARDIFDREIVQYLEDEEDEEDGADLS